MQAKKIFARKTQEDDGMQCFESEDNSAYTAIEAIA
jgi:hypothetical protein